MTIAQTIGKPSPEAVKRSEDKRKHPLSKDASLRSARFVRTETVSISHTATLPDDTDYQMIFDPAFWRFVTPTPGVGDTIVIRNDALTLYATALVVASNREIGEVELRQLSYAELPPADHRPDARSGFAATYEGVTLQWCVRRTADNRLMASSIKDRTTALQRIMSEFYGKVA